MWLMTDSKDSCRPSRFLTCRPEFHGTSLCFSMYHPRLYQEYWQQKKGVNATAAHVGFR